MENVEGRRCHLIGWSERPVEKVTLEQTYRSEE